MFSEATDECDALDCWPCESWSPEPVVEWLPVFKADVFCLSLEAGRQVETKVIRNIAMENEFGSIPPGHSRTIQVNRIPVPHSGSYAWEVVCGREQLGTARIEASVV